MGFLHHRRPLCRLLRDSLDPSPRGLGARVSTSIWLGGGALLRTPTRSFLCDRPGGAICAAPTDLSFDGVICAALAGLPHSVSWSGCFSSTLAGVAPVP